MALVATVSRRTKNASGTHHVIGTLAFDSSYPTGGESWATTLGVSVLHLSVSPNGGYVFEPDYTNKKVKAFVPVSVAGGAAAAGTDALSIKDSVVNKEAATAMHSKMQEVPNTTDLSALTAVPFEADVL